MKNSKDKIKVLFRHRSMEMGGVEKVLLNIVENLDPNKFEITVLLNLNQGELRDEFPNHVRKEFLVKGREDLSKNKWIQKVQLVLRKLKIEKLLENSKWIDEQILGELYDIEVAMTYNDFPLVLNSSNPNSKKIGWFHSEVNIPKFKPLLSQILLDFPKFDVMVYCADKIKNIMHENHSDLKYPEEYVIFNAIPIKEIRQKASEEINDFPDAEIPTFISIGRLHNRKGYDRLLRAHSQLINDGFQHQIIIIGEGEEEGKLKKLRKELQVENSFQLLGGKMNPYPYIKQSNYFILPSKSEAWPLVIAEALILQKPTIATKVGDIPAMIEDGKTGLLINPEVDELYEAMKRFLTEPELVKNIEKNLENIDEQFDNEKIYSQIEELFLSKNVK